MADNTAPLLPPSAAAAGDTKAAPPPSSVEEVIETCVGATGTAQLLRALLVSLAWGFDAQQTFISAFTDASPSWHCTTAACSGAATTCSLPDGSWSWDSPAHTTIVSEWSLQCEPPVVVGLPASAYFVGCLAGGFLLATLADSILGRKNLLFLSVLTMSLAAALTVFSPNIWVYSLLKFIIGIGRSTVGATSLVLANETVGKTFRDWLSVACYLFFTAGFLSLPAMAYLSRASSWRLLYLYTSIPSFIYSIAIYFFVRESPRWLLVRGRKDEAISTLKQIASENGTVLDCDLSVIAYADNTSSSSAGDVLSAMKTLWEKKWAFRRLVATMIASFGMGAVYYGMPLNVGNLGSNLYLSVTFNALAELPSSLITFILIRMVNRRSSTLVFSTLSGVFSVLCVVLGSQAWRMTSEVVSFFSACTAFNVLLIYSTELFPTCVRNSAVSMVRQALVFGGVFAPVLVAAGREEAFLSFGVFGLLIGCCGLFVACLPETRGRGISDTMEEEEEKEYGLVGSDDRP